MIKHMERLPWSRFSLTVNWVDVVHEHGELSTHRDKLRGSEKCLFGKEVAMVGILLLFLTRICGQPGKKRP